jgi:formylglycine-generating enzyme required for sulfatase activity
MEYATRAGTVTSRYFGEREDLLSKYAWYAKNSQERTWPVGSLKPNDLGLFDMQGNAWTWCQEANYAKGQRKQPYEDKEYSLIINLQDGRVLRGGSFVDRAVILRSADRDALVPAYRFLSVGLRAARTLTP